MKDRTVIEALIVSSTKEFDSETLKAIASIAETDPSYLLNLAKSLRQDKYTRHIAVKLLVEITVAVSLKNHRLPPDRKTTLPSVIHSHIPNIITTATDVVDAIAYYIHKNKKKSKMPLSLKRGLAKSLSQFTAEELLKCREYKNKSVTLGDTINLLHPKASTHDMQVIFRYLRGWDFDWEETQEVLKKFSA